MSATPAETPAESNRAASMPVFRPDRTGGRISPRTATALGWLSIATFAVLCVAIIGCTIWFGLREAQAKDGFAIWASGATLLGIFLTIGALLVAWITYQSGQRAGRHAHMHGLFRDFLRFEAEFAEKNNAHNDPDEAARATAGQPLADKIGFRLYTMEEMWAWIRAEERRNAWRWWWLGEPSAMEAWRRTVRSHVTQLHGKQAATSGLYRHLDEYADCYGADFLRVVAFWCGGEVAALVEDEFAQRVAPRTKRLSFSLHKKATAAGA